MRHRIRRDAAWLALALTLAVLVGSMAARIGFAIPVEAPQDPDDEERQIEAAMNRRLFEENCLMCHAEEMTSRQRLTPKQWAAEVEKMIGWGAPVPLEEKGRLIAYLSDRYRADATAPEVERKSPEEALALEDYGVKAPLAHRGDASRGGELYAKNCASCHGPDGAGGDLGTNLVEKPVLLQVGRYRSVVLDGLRRMPAFKEALDPSQADDILAWLRDRRPAR